MYNDLSKCDFSGDDEQEIYFREKLSDIGYSSYFKIITLYQQIAIFSVFKQNKHFIKEDRISFQRFVL